MGSSQINDSWAVVMPIQKGVFISFEGGEGTGKSTQIRRFTEFLKKKGIDVVVTREPGGTLGAEEIRYLLLQGSPDRWGAMTEALLMFAARKDHVDRLISPSLSQGKWVLCDRFTDSSWVYQGYVGGVGEQKIERLQEIVLDGIEPDLTFILDLPPKIGLDRTQDRKSVEDRFENKGESFHQKVHEGYHKLFEKNKGRCILISALGEEQEVFDRILEAFFISKIGLNIKGI